MTQYAPRSLSLNLASPTQSTIPDWAVERLSGLGTGSGYRMLEQAIRSAGDPESRRFGQEAVMRHLRPAWEETVMMPIMRTRNEALMDLRRHVGGYASADRATDLLARCIPLLGRYEEGTTARRHLDHAIGFLEAAAAVEAVLLPPTAGKSKSNLHDAQNRAMHGVMFRLHDAHQALSSALRSASADIREDPDLVRGLPVAQPRRGPAPRVVPSQRPATGMPDAPAPGPDAVAVPPFQAIWEAYLKRDLTDLLTGGHGLEVRGAKVAAAGGTARYEVTFSRDAAEVRFALAFAAGNPVPTVTRSIGKGDAFRTTDLPDIHRTLHEGRNDPASVRLVSELLREASVADICAIGATGPRSIRVSGASGRGNAPRFLDALAKIEDLAEERGVKIEVGVDGVGLRVSDMVSKGYEWSGRKGETLMARKPPAAMIRAFG